jgi:hypothetical protein
VPLEECESVAQDIVRYVARPETVVLTMPAWTRRISTTRTSEERGQIRLSMPVLSQGGSGNLYVKITPWLARSATPGCYFARTVGQAAVSSPTPNSDELELEVQKRTRELSERSREVGAMLNSLEQGVFDR